jgi:hypothetical protein
MIGATPITHAEMAFIAVNKSGRGPVRPGVRQWGSSVRDDHKLLLFNHLLRIVGELVAAGVLRNRRK